MNRTFRQGLLSAGPPVVTWRSSDTGAFLPGPTPSARWMLAAPARTSGLRRGEILALE